MNKRTFLNSRRTYVLEYLNRKDVVNLNRILIFSCLVFVEKHNYPRTQKPGRFTFRSTKMSNGQPPITHSSEGEWRGCWRGLQLIF
jgi:hypothetical protein